MKTQGAAARGRHRRPAASLPLFTRGWRRCRCPQETPVLSKTLRSFPNAGRTGILFSPAGAPQPHVRPGNSDLEPKEGRAGCENTLERTKGSLDASLYPIPSRARPRLPSPLREQQPVAKREQRKGYSYSIPKKVLSRVLRTPKHTRWVFFF